MNKTRLTVVTAMVAAFAMVLSGLAMADDLLGDELTETNTAVSQNGSLDFGTVCVGSTQSRTLSLAVRRQGGGAAVYKDSSVVTVTPLSATAGLTAGQPSGTISIPGDWSHKENGTLTNVVTATITLDTSVPTTLSSGSVAYRAAGVNGHTGNTLTREDTIPVTAVVESCAVPPTVDYTINPPTPTGDNGWYTSDVTLTWNITGTTPDLTGCEDQSITVDQTEQTYSCTAQNSAGSAGPVSVSIKRDATPPAISGSDVTNTTWRNTDLVESFTAADATSDLADLADGSFTLTASAESLGASSPTVVSRTVKDKAGNSSTRSVSALIDKTKPTNVSFAGVADGSYSPTTLPDEDEISCNADDALSGLDSCVVSGYSSAFGSHTLTATATDHAGNQETAKLTYSVVYTFGGWQAPVNALPTRNVVKAGRAIPIKFTLDGDQGLAIFANSTATNPGGPKVTASTCDQATPADPVEDTLTAGGSSLQYDSASGTYTYVWKSDTKWAGKCMTLALNLRDGSNHIIAFQFTK